MTPRWPSSESTSRYATLREEFTIRPASDSHPHGAVNVDQEHIIGTFNISTMASRWTEYLCMEVATDGSVTLTSKSREVLGADWSLEDDDVVWPDGFDPDDEDCDDRPLPVSIGGKKVIDLEDGCYLGDKLLPHSDGATATFKPGNSDAAANWVLEYYRDAFPSVADETLRAIKAALER